MTIQQYFEENGKNWIKRKILEVFEKTALLLFTVTARHQFNDLVWCRCSSTHHRPFKQYASSTI